MSLLKESTDCLILKLRQCKQVTIKSIIDSNMLTVKINNEFLIKSYEEFISGLISETEYQLFKRNFSIRIQNAEKNIAVLCEELRRVDSDTYMTKLIERFSEHKNISELDRCVIVKLIKSIVVKGNDDINIKFRYLNSFELPTKEQEHD